MPTISVVIPVYNRKEQIICALRSVYNQTLLPDEVIVVDDGSADGTYEAIQEGFPQVRLIRQKHRGVSAARNRGIEESGGDFIAFLDSDDIWLPDKLRLQIGVFNEHPELGLLATQKYKNTNSYSIKTIKKPRLHYLPFSDFLKRTKVNTPTIMIPRKVFKAVGLFDITLTTSEDWDLWARIAYRYPVARIEQPLTAVFESPNSISMSRVVKYSNDIAVISRWNPKRSGTYDSEGRMNSFRYQWFLVRFAFFRSIRLLKHCGYKDTKEFLHRVEKTTGISPSARLFLTTYVQIAGFLSTPLY